MHTHWQVIPEQRSLVGTSNYTQYLQHKTPYAHTILVINHSIWCDQIPEKSEILGIK